MVMRNVKGKDIKTNYDIIIFLFNWDVRGIIVPGESFI